MELCQNDLFAEKCNLETPLCFVVVEFVTGYLVFNQSQRDLLFQHDIKGDACGHSREDRLQRTSENVLLSKSDLKNQSKMTSNEEKKTLPPAEVLVGGVFPDEIAAIKKKARGENARRLKIGIAVGSALLVIFVVVGGTLLGLHLNRKPAVVTRSVKLVIEDEIVEETVEVDKERDTETFRTVSSNGTSLVIRDMTNGLSAYRFDGDEKCYILYEDLEESKDTEELSEDLEQMEEGELDVAEGSEEMFLSVDADRGKMDRSELSEGMKEFCEGLKTHWAVKSSFKPPTPTPTPAAEDEEEDPTPVIEALSGSNGTNAVQEREKRSDLLWRTVRDCHWESRRVCCHRCRQVCSKRRRRRGLSEEAPGQELQLKKRVRRGWFIDVRRVVSDVVRFVCRAVCGFFCYYVNMHVCIVRRILIAATG